MNKKNSPCGHDVSNVIGTSATGFQHPSAPLGCQPVQPATQQPQEILELSSPVVGIGCGLAHLDDVIDGALNEVGDNFPEVMMQAAVEASLNAIEASCVTLGRFPSPDEFKEALSKVEALVHRESNRKSSRVLCQVADALRDAEPTLRAEHESKSNTTNPELQAPVPTR